MQETDWYHGRTETASNEVHAARRTQGVQNKGDRGCWGSTNRRGTTSNATTEKTQEILEAN